MKNFLFCCSLFYLLIQQAWAAPFQQVQQVWPMKRVLHLTIELAINPATLNYIQSGIKKAEQENYQGLLIQLNTPGGLVSTTKDILTSIGPATVPIIIWVGPEGASATSAGAIISSAAHFLFMAKGTNIGAATPIDSGGDIASKDLRAKAINDLKATVKGQAELHGRNGQAFQEMIEKASSFSSEEAHKLHLIDGLAHSLSEIGEQLKGRIWIKGEKQYRLETDATIQWVPYSMDVGQSILNVFADPQLAYLLFIFGAVLIYFELQAPGGFIAGAIGAICLILSGLGLQVLPLNFGAAGLILLSFILFVLEMYVSSFGLLAVAGLVALLFGSLFLYRSPDSYLDFGVHVIYATVGSVACFLAFLSWYWWQDSKKNKVTHFFQHQGRKGIVHEVLENGEYLCRIDGETWTCLPENSSTLQVQDKIEVLSMADEQMKMIVKKIES